MPYLLLPPAAPFLYSCRKVANEERKEGERDSGADATANLPMDTDGDGRKEGRGPIHKEKFCNKNCNENCNEIQF